MTEENLAGQASLIDAPGTNFAADLMQASGSSGDKIVTSDRATGGEPEAAQLVNDTGGAASSEGDADSAGNTPGASAETDQAQADGAEGDDASKSEGDQSDSASDVNEASVASAKPREFTIAVCDTRGGNIVHAVKIVGGVEFVQFTPEGEWIEV